MSTFICGKCESGLEPDDDHVKVDMEVRRINDRNDREEFALCMDCFLEVNDEWSDPV